MSSYSVGLDHIPCIILYWFLLGIVDFSIRDYLVLDEYMSFRLIFLKTDRY